MDIGNQNSLEPQCKNCQHPIAMHKPNCLSGYDDKEDKTCGCENPEYYNALISCEHIGWTEIHCNSCGTLLGLIDSTIENIFDYTTVCPHCIDKVTHHHK